MRPRVSAVLGLLPVLLCACEACSAQAVQTPPAPNARVQREADRVLEWIKFHGRLPRRTHRAQPPAPGPAEAAQKPAEGVPPARLAQALQADASALPVLASPWPRPPVLELVVERGQP